MVEVFGAILIASVEFITLHQGDGREIDVNPKKISRLVEARQSSDPKKQFADNIRCLIWFDDAYMGVTETCADVRRIIDQAGN